MISANIVPKFTVHDFIFMYWISKPKPVFLNKTLLKGLHEQIKLDATQGFNRLILERLYKA